MRTACLIAVLLLAVPCVATAIEVDGRIDPAEWAGARHVTEFRQVQPLTGNPGTLATEAWILATPEGLAVGFRNHQPPGVTRTRQRVQRDFDEQVDRVNLMVDFDGGGRTGYNFTVSSTNGIYDAVITNETQFNDDWDGNWRHAVAEDADGWSVEMLIPWYIAPMPRAAGDTRTINLYLDRVVGSTGERVAWPVASFERSRFVSEFAPVAVPAYSTSLLAVTPYVSGLHDLARSGTDLDAGADLFWKPNGQFQLAATINPDFGQVESDDLVVNFSATETFVSDKRPFFTENQGLSSSPRRPTSASCSTPAASAGPRTTATAPATSPPRSRSTAASAAPATACSRPTRATRSGDRSARCAWCTTSAPRTSA